MCSIGQNRVIFLGAGGHASVLMDCLLDIGDKILGIVDPKYSIGDCVLGNTILGADEAILQFSPEDVVLVNGIGMVESNNARQEATVRLQRLGYVFLTITHPKANVSSRVQLGEGVQIMAGAVVQAGTKIGNGSIVNTGALVDHDCVIGSGSHICPGVTLAGSVTVGDEVMVGSGSTVLPGITIGSRSVVGAGSVVCSDVESGISVIQRRELSTCNLSRD